MNNIDIDISDLDWNLFEEQFQISKDDVIEVKNIFRHVCRLFVNKSDLELWNEKYSNFENVKVNIYEIYKDKYNNKKWLMVRT